MGKEFPTLYQIASFVFPSGKSAEPGMMRFCVFIFLLFSFLLQPVSIEKCQSSFECGKHVRIEFPFTTTERPDCGDVVIRGCDNLDPRPNKTAQLPNMVGGSFDVLSFLFPSIIVRDNKLHNYLRIKSCEAFKNNITLPPPSHLASYEILNNITIFRCNHNLKIRLPQHFSNYPNCSDYNIFYSHPNTENSPSSDYPRSLAACSTIQLPVRDQTDSNDPFTFLTAEFMIHALSDCEKCHHHWKLGSRCQLDSGKILYFKDDRTWVWKMGLGISIVGLIVGLFLAWHYKRKLASSKLQLQCSRNIDSYLNMDPESCRVYFGVPVFSPKELEEATNNFNANRKLGDGGFGAVYYGKLQDGREVAIKHLYDHNYRRVQQFMNEVEILTRLRHNNLVSLYGCTSLHSHELLLVYEYVPNGTVASHLHGHLANLSLLSWPIRMKIAIETASALTYLHASNIIHRDVKTNNILLDSNYTVKVADFGISRLFLGNATHVSTAPQGTPGYVDPEYHQCHQLTCKSDVYSFGVVLIELISSMPPVNMTRHKDEINLENLAMKKIRNDAISELVDPSLGFHSNNDVKRTTTSMTELAFRRLQWENELLPPMDEVLEALKRIVGGKDDLIGDLKQAYVPKEEINSCNINVMPPTNSLDCDKVGLLQGAKLMASPTTMIDNWESGCTTPNDSG